MISPLKYFSMFSGIGGFELGIERAYESLRPTEQKMEKGRIDRNSLWRRIKKNKQGVSCIGYSEIDKYAIQVYERHFPEHKNYGDISQINPKDLPDLGLLVGGFPCQSFSIAGKRAGFDDTRGTLFFDILRIAKEKQPRLLLLENVKGLLSHAEGRTFGTILASLDELGYDLDWQVLNSKDFGVPQNRERVFIVGHLRGTPRPKVFPIGEGNEEYNEPDAQGNDIAHTLNCGDKHRGSYIIEDFYPDRIRTFDKSPTLRGDRQGLKVTQETKIRRLTPLECERLMGLPDGWTREGLSYTMEVCVNISPALSKQLPKSDIVLNTTSGGNEMEFRLCQKEWSKDASIAIAEPLPVRTALGTINLGKDTVMLFNQKEMWNIDVLLKPNATYEKAVNQFTKKLWRITLDEKLEKEKLSTILIWIQEIMTSPTSSFAKIGGDTIGVIIRLNSVVPSYSGGESLSLKMGNIVPVSDTQRYKLCGNGVVVNVVRAITERLL